MTVIDAIRADAAAVLSDGRAKLVIGYGVHSGRRCVAMITSAAQAGTLVFDEQCMQNPAAYLRKPEVRQLFPAAVVARPAVMRSLVVLAAESQITKADVLVLAAGPSEYHGLLDLPGAVELLRQKYANMSPGPELLAGIQKLAAMTPAQRAAFWNEQFSKCTRCYACRSCCPGCYCKLCAATNNRPQWISTVPDWHGNFAWHMMRAYHQAGRCTLCGACQAGCPQDLPLMLLNAWVETQVREEFGYQSGYDLEAKPFTGSWKKEDDDKFVK